MTPLSAEKYLDSFINYEFNLNKVSPCLFRLDRMQRLLNLLGDPQKAIKIIHIAGTNGKGSCCSFVANILQKAGFKVGLYTSPHLVHRNERIRILDTSQEKCVKNEIFCGKIPNSYLCQLLEEIKPSIEIVKSSQDLGRLTFYEVYTVLALYYFWKEKVDFAILETGLGGRLDATNVVASMVCGITPISFDHTVQLGSSLEEIAKEKAAIIKDEDQKVVIGIQDEKVLEILKKQCQKNKNQYSVIGEDIKFKILSQDLSEQIFYIETRTNQYANLKIQLLGRHQVANAALAVGITERLRDLGFNIETDAIHRGLAETTWPGRVEIICQDPLMILDGAHNPAASRSLIATIKQLWSNRKIILILAISEGKDTEGICFELNKIAEEVISTKARHPRAHNFRKQELGDLFPGKKSICTGNIEEAIQIALQKAKKEKLILIAGSLFIVGEARLLWAD